MSDYSELKRLVEQGSLPPIVATLIAENERLKTLRSKTERELEQELEVWRYGPSCWSCGDTGDVHDMVGEWLGQCDCNAAKLIDVASERDHLKAEVAGLKTGYEAYGQVVQGLKAEIDELVTALNEILRVTPMGNEAFGIAALVLGELGVSKETSHG